MGYSDNSCTTEMLGYGAICQLGEVTITASSTSPAPSSATSPVTSPTSSQATSATSSQSSASSSALSSASTSPATSPTTSPTTQPSTSAAHTECKSGWTIFAGVCYLVVSDRKLNWYNAESYCAEVADTTGGHLVSINSNVEETLVNTLFQSA